MPEAQSSRIGRYVTTVAGGETVRAYVPPPLPPSPPLDMTNLLGLYGRAQSALGRLDGITTLLPSAPLFLYAYVRKEALLSSQIEGTRSSLADLFLSDNDESPALATDDVADVSNYVAAVEHGVGRLREGFPLCLRLIREVHEILLRSARDAAKLPGQFRRSQNWVGGIRPSFARFVPPPADMLADCLDDFERFLHVDDSVAPALLRAGLAHVQFETIHPFLDGNGRTGRLLITLMLQDAGIIQEPILYLSLLFKERRQDYYRLLEDVRLHGAWEAWMDFFLTGIATAAEEAVETAGALMTIVAKDRERIRAYGRAASSVLRVHELMQRRPILTVAATANELGLTLPTVTRAFSRMIADGIMHEATGRQRHRNFVYTRYLALLDQGTEPLPA